MIFFITFISFYYYFSSNNLDILSLCFSGFKHAAFTFGHEAHVFESNINGAIVPPYALVDMLKKGILYVAVEMSESKNEVCIPTCFKALYKFMLFTFLKYIKNLLHNLFTYFLLSIHLCLKIYCSTFSIHCLDILLIISMSF